MARFASALFTPGRLAMALASTAWASAHANPLLTGKAFDLVVGVNSTYSAPTDTITGGLVSNAVGASTLETLKNQLTDANLASINSAYNANAASVVRAGYLGFPLVISAGAASSTVNLNIPGLNINQSFSAKGNRDDNTKDLFDFLKANGSDILSRLQQKLAQVSPISPVAGNPSSLQSRMVADDFDRGFTAFASNIRNPEADGSTSNSNLIGLGLSFQNMDTGKTQTESMTLPLSYTVRNDLDPRRQWTFYAPITQTDTAGAKAYGLNLGVAYRMPINDEWTLMPGVGYGITGSVDLGTAAAMLAASVTSQYTLRMDGYDIAFGNMVGLSQSDKLSIGDYAVDPKINNTVFRNGVLVSMPTSLFGPRQALEFSYILTNYTGSALYSNQYQEVGVTLGSNKGANTARSYLRAGMSYLTGENGISATRLNFGYWF
jgi:hypothetical protein